ncbi:hypothetical protein RND81_09G044800 [Saponaria officinalis]|uniref:Zinc knuckle CX2CX4HX4C domain-containing protein n=1 Tax=Saponaria officinalis TaxID=3572 RepID=A0AAW1IGK9_SAPOF
MHLSLIEVDVSKPLTQHVILNTPFYDGVMQPVEYEWVPYYCRTCKKLGHESSRCKLNKSKAIPQVYRPVAKEVPVPAPLIGVNSASTTKIPVLTPLNEDSALAAEIHVPAANTSISTQPAVMVPVSSTPPPSYGGKFSQSKFEVAKPMPCLVLANRFLQLDNVQSGEGCIDVSMAPKPPDIPHDISLEC